MAWLTISSQRGWPLLVAACLALSAYFQARGAARLIAAELAQAPATAALPRGERRRPKPQQRADVILARNPFDSITGPLDASSGPSPSFLPEPTAVPLSTAPKCEFGYVTLIVAADEGYSFASIETRDGNSRLARVGDTVVEHRIAHIGLSRIWLDDSKARCQMELGDKPAKRKRRATRKKKNKRRKRRRSRRSLPKTIADKIEKVSATEYRIERSAFDAALEQQATLMRGIRARPYKRGDEMVGLRLGRIRGGTLLSALGLKSADVIKSINGFDISNPQKALEAYGRLRTASHLNLEVERRRKSMTFEYQIQ